MKNIVKKSLFIIAGCLIANVCFGQQTTFGFESESELSSNFTYSCEYNNATMTISTEQKHGGSSSLQAYMGGSGGKSNWLITKNSYSNVTQFKFWLASSDKGKTEFAIESCASSDFSSGVNTILALTTFSELPGISSPSNKTFYEVTITPSSTVSGYLRFTFKQPSSSGKYLWLDDLEISASATPSTDPVSSVTLAGPDVIFIGQKASYSATTDKTADVFKWTVNNVEQNGVTGATFDYTPSAAGTYTIQAYAKNEYNTDWVVSNSINLVASEKTELVQVSIDKTTVWDWTKAGTGSIEWTASTTPQKDMDTVVLANIDGINNNADFNSQALRFAGQYPIRDGKYCQGPWISFKTTVAGYVQVDFSNTGTKDEARYIAINGVVNTEVGTKNTNSVTSANIAVPAGDVVIEGSFDPYAAQYLRIYKITFSTDASAVAVESVSLDKSTLTIEVGQTAQLTATVSPANADNKNISWSSDDNTIATVDGTGLVSALAAGTATITVTTEDDNKTATCAVTVTAPAAPIEVESISIKSATTISIGGSETLSVTYTPADANTGKAITWTSNNEAVATVDANGKVTGVAAGTATITATSEKGKTATCTVTVEAVSVTGVSLNKSTLSLEEGKSETLTATVLPANATNKNVSWSSSNTTVATVNANGAVTAVKAGSATITVTTEDGSKTATCAVTVQEASPVPQTNLSLHVPEVYEAKQIAGGYGGTLSVFEKREYEVYYCSYDSSSNLSVTVSPAKKKVGISGAPRSSTTVRAADNWFEGTAAGGKSDYSFTQNDEFVQGAGAMHKLKKENTYTFHIQGFDQFSFLGKDNNADPSKGRHFEVYVDDVLQPMTLSSTATIRRFTITTGRHLIRLKAIHDGDSNSELYGFSLRVAQEPRTNYLMGNDSAQVKKPYEAITPVTYTTKYNNVPGAETRLEWLGAAVDGISLQKIDGVLTDTLVLQGTANAPAGEYKYAVVAYYNGIETSRAEGKFYIEYAIKATTETSTVAYQGEAMDEIKCKYSVYDETTDIIFLWTSGTGDPGITTSAKNGIFTIGGTPTTVGTYAYIVTVAGGDTVQGTIRVESSDLGVDPILYLYKTKTDYIYTYLKECGYNLKERQTKDDLRSADQYAKYKWILISEDVDANNPEVFKIMRGGVDMPILNMKAFSYAHAIDSLKDAYGGSWGEADNGSLSENGKYITVWRDDHPIFKAMNKKQGDRIQVLDSIERKGLMPIKVTQGGLCLATALKRDRMDYYGDGDPETFLHEKPAGLDGGNSKYISFPVSMSSSKYLSDEGKNLLKATIEYLLSNNPSVRVPEVRIVEFKLGDIVVRPEIGTYTITLEIDTTEHPELADLTEVVPEITLASPYTFTIPAQDSVVNMSYAPYMAFNYIVSDYIHREVYDIKIVWRKPQGIEEVYSVGEWVNVYDIFGRKIATTNEDIYTMSLPRGVYIIVTENGQTLKISR